MYYNTPSEIARELAGRLRLRRLTRRWTQAELAKRVGIPLPAYARFERTGDISFNRLVSVFYELGLLSEIENLAKQLDLSLFTMDELVSLQRARESRLEVERYSIPPLPLLDKPSAPPPEDADENWEAEEAKKEVKKRLFKSD